MGFKTAFKKTRKPNGDYVNGNTGETLDSEIPNLTSYNVADTEYCIVDSKDYFIIDSTAIAYLKEVLTTKDMNYVMQMASMCRGEYNALYSDVAPHTRETLAKELDLAKTRFCALLKKLYDEGVISYLYSKINRQKEVKYILLNPTIARKTKRISIECRKLFRDLTVPQ